MVTRYKIKPSLFWSCKVDVSVRVITLLVLRSDHFAQLMKLFESTKLVRFSKLWSKISDSVLHLVPGARGGTREREPFGCFTMWLYPSSGHSPCVLTVHFVCKNSPPE